MEESSDDEENEEHGNGEDNREDVSGKEKDEITKQEGIKNFFWVHMLDSCSFVLNEA